MIATTVLTLFFALIGTASPIPTVEKGKVEASYQEVGQRQMTGECAAMAPLAQMLKEKDGVTDIISTPCDNVIFTPPSDADGSAKAFMAFVSSDTKAGVFFRGTWNAGDFDLKEISYDQKIWSAVEKGRVRIYRKDDGSSTMFVVFAVYGSETKKGVAFKFEG